MVFRDPPILPFILSLRGAYLAVTGAVLLGGLWLLWQAMTGDAFVVILLVLLGLLLWRSGKSPDAGLTGVIAVALLLPFAVVPVDLGLKPSFLNLAVLLAYLRWIWQAIRQESLRPLPIYTTGLIVLFGAWALSAALWGLNFARPSLFEMRKVLEYLLSLGLFLLVLHTVHTPRRIRYAAAGVAIAGTLSALLGLIVYFLPPAWAQTLLEQFAAFDYPAGATALRYVNDDPRGTLRAIGLVIDPNLLGAQSVLAACILLPLLLEKKGVALRLGLGLALLLIGAAIYLTYSRNALLAIGAAAAFMAWLRYRVLLPAGLAGILLLAFLPQTQAYAQRLVEGLLGQDLATQMRFAEYRNAWAIIRAYPWSGVGFFGTPSLAYQAGAPSMVPLAVATTMGLPALGLFLFLWGMPLARFLQARARWRRHALAPWALGLAGSAIGLGMTGLFDHFYFNMLYPHMSALYWILLGLCTQALKAIETDPETTVAAAHSVSHV